MSDVDTLDREDREDVETTEAKPKRKRGEHTAVYTFEPIDQLPENLPNRRAGQSGWRGAFERLVEAHQNGELRVDSEGRSQWVILARYGTRNSASTAIKAIVKRQMAAAEDSAVEPAIPVGWGADVESRRTNDGSVLAARVYRK